MQYQIQFEKIIHNGNQCYRVDNIVLPKDSQLTSKLIDDKKYITMEGFGEASRIVMVEPNGTRFCNCGDIITVSQYDCIRSHFKECMELYSCEIARVRRLKDYWKGTCAVSADLSSEDGVCDVRYNNGRAEHIHKGYEYWHPIDRIHIIDP